MLMLGCRTAVLMQAICSVANTAPITVQAYPYS